MSTIHSPDYFADIRHRGGSRYAAFLVAGYQELHHPGGSRHTTYLLQKEVCRDGHRFFYINTYVYDRWKGDTGSRARFVSYEPEVQFNAHPSQQPTFDVTLLDQDMSPAEIEVFFLAVYDRLGCQPYGD